MNKKIFGIVVCMLVMTMGLCCVSVSANVRVFVTSSQDPYGLERVGLPGFDPDHPDWLVDPFRPTYSEVDSNGNNVYAYDYYYGYFRASAYPPIDAPLGTVDNPILIQASAGEWGYIWFQFCNEQAGKKINALLIQIWPAGQPYEPTPYLNFTYYVQNDMWNPDLDGQKRWEGSATPPYYPEWHNNPQTFLAILSNGIKNLNDNPQLTFGHVALLGSVWGSPSDTVYELFFYTISYWGRPDPPPADEHAYFKIITFPGDLDFDNDIDYDDYLMFLASYGHGIGQPQYDSDADLDHDGAVTLIDYQLWRQSYCDYVGDPNAPLPTSQVI